MELPVELWFKILTYCNFTDIQRLVVSIPCISNKIKEELGNDHIKTSFSIKAEKYFDWWYWRWYEKWTKIRTITFNDISIKFVVWYDNHGTLAIGYNENYITFINKPYSTQLINCYLCTIKQYTLTFH